MALLDLFEATYDVNWLKFGIELDKILAKYYEDRLEGGFYMTSDEHEELLVREKPFYDSAKPSGNSVTALNLLRLYKFTTDNSYLERANNVFMTSS
jgi:uncharacterized protein YyaL (SSP411 family)